MRTHNMMQLSYLHQPPKRCTFEMLKLKKYVEGWCRGKTLNLFSGQTRLRGIDEYRVDIDPTTKPDFIGDAYEFIITTPLKFDTVILDPPYNTRKSREKYNGRWIGNFKKIKDALPPIINDGGIVISLGYDTVGMSRSRGFEKIAACIICHLGDHNDTLCLVERKANMDIMRITQNGNLVQK